MYPHVRVHLYSHFVYLYMQFLYLYNTYIRLSQKVIYFFKLGVLNIYNQN